MYVREQHVLSATCQAARVILLPYAMTMPQI
jgi:hypothetical protein